MENGEDFVDYYKLMQVDPSCDAKTLESAYRYFAKLYHPDHAKTADVAKFSQFTEAYRILRDPVKRAEYDHSYPDSEKTYVNPIIVDEGLEVDHKSALKDAEIHEKVLLHLYKRRREHAYDAGVVGWLLQETLCCSDDNFEFHIWYLKSKGFIDITEQGTLAITIQGVDHVISHSRAHAEKLLIASAAETE